VLPGSQPSRRDGHFQHHQTGRPKASAPLCWTTTRPSWYQASKPFSSICTLPRRCTMTPPLLAWEGQSWVEPRHKETRDEFHCGDCRPPRNYYCSDALSAQHLSCLRSRSTRSSEHLDGSSARLGRCLEKPRTHLLSKGVGVSALSLLAGDIITSALLSSERPDAQAFIEYLRPLATLDWSTSGTFKGLGGRHGASEAHQLLTFATLRTWSGYRARRSLADGD